MAWNLGITTTCDLQMTTRDVGHIPCLHSAGTATCGLCVRHFSLDRKIIEREMGELSIATFDNGGYSNSDEI